VAREPRDSSTWGGTRRKRSSGASHFRAPGKRGWPPTSSWPLFSRPTPHAASRELGSFFRSIWPLFVLNPYVPTTNTRSIWLRFGAFLSPSAPFLGIHWPLCFRPTLHAPRLTLHAPPAGSGRARTLPRWLLPDTDRRIEKDRTGPDLEERPLYFQRLEKRLETRRFLGRRPEFLVVCRVVVYFSQRPRTRLESQGTRDHYDDARLWSTVSCECEDG
jgi:hypothetical protein